MEETHNYAMNLIVPLMGIAPLLMLFILKGEKKSKVTKRWNRSTYQNYKKQDFIFIIIINKLPEYIKEKYLLDLSYF